MRRACFLLVGLAACRLGFDPVEGDGVGETMFTGATNAHTFTAAPGSDFYQECPAGEPCTVDCAAASTCLVECGLASSCDVTCSAVDCIVESCVAPACDVACIDGPIAQLGATAICSGS